MKSASNSSTLLVPFPVKAIKNRIVRQENGINPRRDSRVSTDQEDVDEDELEEEEEEEEDEGGGMRVSAYHRCNDTHIIFYLGEQIL